MNKKEQLIETIDQILKSQNSTLCQEDRQQLEKVKEALKKAKSKEEIISALRPIAYLFHLIKAVVDFF